MNGTLRLLATPFHQLSAHRLSGYFFLFGAASVEETSIVLANAFIRTLVSSRTTVETSSHKLVLWSTCPRLSRAYPVPNVAVEVYAVSSAVVFSSKADPIKHPTGSNRQGSRPRPLHLSIFYYRLRSAIQGIRETSSRPVAILPLLSRSSTRSRNCERTIVEKKLGYWRYVCPFRSVSLATCMFISFRSKSTQEWLSLMLHRGIQCYSKQAETSPGNWTQAIYRQALQLSSDFEFAPELLARDKRHTSLNSPRQDSPLHTTLTEESERQ